MFLIEVDLVAYAQSCMTMLKVAWTDIICQTIVQHCRTSDLELTATCCVKLRLSLYFQIQT